MELNLTTTAVSENENLTVKLPFGELGTAVIAGTLYPMAVFGLIANVITIVVIYRAPSLRSIFNFYIMSLCTSDLISAIFSPLYAHRMIWGYEFEDWKIPHFFCKLYWAADMGTSAATSFHIAGFSALRFLSTAKPHLFRRITLTHAKISIISIWIFSIGFGFVPYAIFMGVSKINRSAKVVNRGWPVCAIALQWLPQFQVYTSHVNILLFMAPLIVVFVLSFATSLVIYIRRSQRRKGKTKRKMQEQFTALKNSCKARKKRLASNENEAERNRIMKENHAILQLTLIVGSYALGYIPTTIFLKMAPTIPTETHEERIRLWWHGCISFVCLRFSECLNPIFYNLASSKLRAETVKWFRMVVGCKKVNPQAGNGTREDLSGLTSELVNDNLLGL